MKNIRDPNEPLLFDNTTVGLTAVARNLLKGSWWELMRTAILRLMPVERIGAKLSEKTGRPSKELYSVCALLFVKDYFGWTFREAVERYVFDVRVRYAFNIGVRPGAVGGHAVPLFAVVHGEQGGRGDLHACDAVARRGDEPRHVVGFRFAHLRLGDNHLDAVLRG